MLIKVERECCDPVEDLKPYKGNIPNATTWISTKDRNVVSFLHKTLQFCPHCGQIWGYSTGPWNGVESPTIRVKIFPSQEYEE